MVADRGNPHRQTLQKPIVSEVNSISLPKWDSKVFLNDSVYRELAFTFLHFFGLHFPHGKSYDSQLHNNATRNIEKRNAF